jgi:hypothetical protein
LKKIKKYFQKNLTNVNFFRTFAYIFKKRSLNNKKLSKKMGSANEPKNKYYGKKYVGLLPKHFRKDGLVSKPRWRETI